MNLNFKQIRENGDLLLEIVRGSHLYGLETESSDIDTFGVFCGPIDWFIGNGKDLQTMIKSDKCDDYWDELSKYFTELGKSNPEALVSLFTPEKYILHFSPELQPLWDIKDQLLTKECFNSFSRYASSQIKKAKGLNKAINTDPIEVKERKTPLSFCQIPIGIGTLTLKKWLNDNGLKQEYCGISRLPGTIECYSLFYDWGADKDLDYDVYAKMRYNKNSADFDIRGELISLKRTKEIKYRGIISQTDPLTSQLRLSSIEKNDEPLCWFQFNHNAYTSHCIEYKRYWDWVEHRNKERFKLNEGHNWDGKNISHCVRLMTMAKEIAQGKGMLLDRREIDRDWLLRIKTHQVGSYDEIMNYVNNLQEDMEESFEKSNLPDSPDLDMLNSLMIKIRKLHYKKLKLITR